MRIYLAGPLFSQAERIWNRELARLLTEQHGLEVFLPQDFKFEGRYPGKPHYGSLFRECRDKIGLCDAMVAVLDGADTDSGTAWEVGFAVGQGRPVIGVRTDFRQLEEKGVNIMLSRSVDAWISYPFQEELPALAKSIARRLKRLDPPGSRT
jgi:nucleoside 2-deoxyribosyltransferase